LEFITHTIMTYHQRVDRVVTMLKNDKCDVSQRSLLSQHT